MENIAVVAIGGNALPSGSNQVRAQAYRKVGQVVTKLWRSGFTKVLCVHGNGPQVGHLLLQQESSEGDPKTDSYSLFECTALTGGVMGFGLQHAIQNVWLEEVGNYTAQKPIVSTMITDVQVDPNDKAFSNPTKPVGRYYTKEEAELLRTERPWKIIEDSGRGYRRVVPSPRPTHVVQELFLQKILAAGPPDEMVCLIVAGGGGVPVISAGSGFQGIDAVIDKDFSASLLATKLRAALLLVLTAVDFVYRDFGLRCPKEIRMLPVKEAKQAVEEGLFAAGSMKPKVEAVIQYFDTMSPALGEVTPKSIITSVEAVLSSTCHDFMDVGTHFVP